MGTQKNRLNEHPKHMLKIMGKNIFSYVDFFVYLNLCSLGCEQVSISKESHYGYKYLVSAKFLKYIIDIK